MRKRDIIAIRVGNSFYVYLFGLLGIIIISIVIKYFGGVSIQFFGNPISASISIFLLLTFTYATLKFLDKKPLLIVSESAISIRKSRLPFSGLETIPWNEISCYRATSQSFKGGATYWLTIERKSIKKKYYVDLLDLRTDYSAILKTLKEQSIKHNFMELSREKD